MPAKDVVTIAITGGAGQIAYSLAPLIARGAMLGPRQQVALRLLDIEPAMRAAEGVTMELGDSALPLLASATSTCDPRSAFEGADIVIMCGAMPRKPGMERKDLLDVNGKIFAAQGAIIGEVASADCRVLIVGNPANTNALVLTQAAGGKLNPKNVTALTRLDMNRITHQIASRLQVGVADVRNATIWGNHSNTQVPDALSAKVRGASIVDTEPFGADFVKMVQVRGAAIIAARGLSSACSAAAAIVDHVHDWMLGTSPAEVVSMAVWSTGNPYGIPDGLFFSFPVTCTGGSWSFSDVPMPEALKPLIEITTKELLEERDTVACYR